ncbi:MAG: hypothetical protein H0X69_11595 [Gemmatimonadales bacterium]|nr:hypothetical protein [Gemmatimonadales bacterium]
MARQPHRLEPNDQLVLYERERYLGAGRIVAVVPVGERSRWVFSLRETARWKGKGKLAERWPVSASIRLYSQLGMVQLRAAADRLLDEARR